MEITLDSKLVGIILQAGSFLFTIGLVVYNFLSHQKLNGNDLKHLATDVKKISENQDKQDTKIDALCEDMAYIKGKEDTADRVVRVLEKALIK